MKCVYMHTTHTHISEREMDLKTSFSAVPMPLCDEFREKLLQLATPSSVFNKKYQSLSLNIRTPIYIYTYTYISIYGRKGTHYVYMLLYITMLVYCVIELAPCMLFRVESAVTCLLVVLIKNVFYSST